MPDSDHITNATNNFTHSVDENQDVNHLSFFQSRQNATFFEFIILDLDERSWFSFGH